MAFGDSPFILEEDDHSAVFDSQADGYQLNGNLFDRYVEYFLSVYSELGFVWQDDDYALCPCSC